MTSKRLVMPVFLAAIFVGVPFLRRRGLGIPAGADAAAEPDPLANTNACPRANSDANPEPDAQSYAEPHACTPPPPIPTPTPTPPTR